ncbi:MAG: hypothetical protein RDV48_11435 [Candidatus Eremiobacteraeota bacterium]|nr:hypothetical protein [Candidatus Eremiobacteraeota bacterium]
MARMRLLPVVVSILLLWGAATACHGENQYSGKRWGFSQLTATPASHIAWSPEGKYLYFTIIGNDTTYLYRIKDVWKIIKGKTLPGNIRPEKVIEVKGRVKDFSISQSRMSMAYSVPEGAEYGGLYVANLVTLETKRIAQGRGPLWSPRDDGRILYYFMGKKGLFGIALINPDGSDMRILSELGDQRPIWSPDGSQIAFLSSRGFSQGTTGYCNIYLMSLNPFSTKQVTHDQNSYQKSLQWAPRGKKILFESYKGVELVDTGNFARTVVVSRGDFFSSHSFEPFFSPDAQWAFFRRETGMGIIGIYTKEEVTVEGSVPWEHVTLAPDGKKVVFSVSQEGKRRGIWVVEAFDR